MGNNRKNRKFKKKGTIVAEGLLGKQSNIMHAKNSGQKYKADSSKSEKQISSKNMNSDSEGKFKRNKCNKRKLQDNKNGNIISSMTESNTEDITTDQYIQSAKKMKKNCSSAKQKLKKSKCVENTGNLKVESHRVPEKSEDSENEDEIRNELKELSIYKKIQQLVKDNPSLQFGIDSNLSENDFMEDNVKYSSSESDSNISDTESVKNSNELQETLSIPSSSKTQSKTINEKNYFSEPLKLYKTKETLIRDHRDKPKVLSFQNKAKEKLQAAKFRCLNEKLYTESGKDSFIYFQENTDDYLDYHNGYSLQVSKWPLNPVDKIINSLQNLQNDSVIADLGCGDAKIARTCRNYKVHSYDLVALNEYVTPCNISKVPLSNESCDIVIFCLSLMGINLKDYLREAHRIAKMGGILKIAEVESRIENLDQFVKNIESLGFKQVNKDIQHKLFVFLDFKKVKNQFGKKTKEIVLKPCLYKKR